MTYNFNHTAVNALFTAITDHARQINVFARVNGHEPRNAPGSQISCSFWLASLVPTRMSGLNAVSGVVTFTGRVYLTILDANAKELDAIDPAILIATGRLMAAYSGGFTLGGTVRAIDLLGQAGTPMSAQAQYIEQDSKKFRVMELNVPVIVNDLWSEAA